MSKPPNPPLALWKIIGAHAVAELLGREAGAHFRPESPLEEGHYPLVDLLAEPAYLALRGAAHPQRLHQVIDRAGRYALDVGFWMTAVSAFSASRRGSRKPGK